MGESADGTWSFTLKLMNVGSTAQTYALDATAMSEQIAEGLFTGSDYNWTGRGIDVTFGGDAKDGKITVQPYNGNDNDGSATLVVNVRATDAFKQFVAENAAKAASTCLLLSWASTAIGMRKAPSTRWRAAATSTSWAAPS